jgi:hypothetical protein
MSVFLWKVGKKWFQGLCQTALLSAKGNIVATAIFISQECNNFLRLLQEILASEVKLAGASLGTINDVEGEGDDVSKEAEAAIRWINYYVNAANTIIIKHEYLFFPQVRAEN